jgi:putative DNA primase/helicase
MDARSRLDAALQYAQHGWAVFPIKPGAKKPPLVKGGCNAASKDPAQVRAWFTEHPDANIGVATGAGSGITVLDVDVKPWDGKRGDETLAALVAEHGELPTTPEQQTWSGGRQYVFAYAEGVRNSAGKLGKDLDIRGDGGYIVVPPSTVSEGQRAGEYAWHVVLDPFTVPPAEMPSWLLERVKSAGAATQATAETAEHGSTTSNANPPGWTDALVHGVPWGSRDDTCWRLVCRYAAKRLTKDEVLGFILAWARSCKPAYPESEAREKVERVFAKMQTELVDYPLTDAGNAERMVVLHGEHFRWVTDREEWLAWDGRRWAPGSVEVVKGYALNAARITQAAAVLLDGESRPKGRPSKRKIIDHALYAESARGISNAVQVAKVLPAVWGEGRALDAEPDLLNVANGTLDLRTFELRPHDPRDLLTRVIDVAYEPGRAGANLAGLPRGRLLRQAGRHRLRAAGRGLHLDGIDSGAVFLPASRRRLERKEHVRRGADCPHGRLRHEAGPGGDPRGRPQPRSRCYPRAGRTGWPAVRVRGRDGR